MIDTHSHMFDAAFDADRPEALMRAKAAGVEKIMMPAIDSASHEAMIGLCNENPGFCMPMMGLHPTSVNDNPFWKNELETVGRYLADPPARGFCAIGEVGLDFYWSKDFIAVQIAVFERQIALSFRYGLPLVIHTREAWPEMVATLEKYAGTGISGVMHAFSGTMDDYRRIRAVGDFVFGVGGSVTYKKSRWGEMLPQMALDSIVLETDAPWLAPVPFRGKRNESSYITYIRDAAAAILGITPEKTDGITTTNAKRIFKL